MIRLTVLGVLNLRGSDGQEVRGILGQPKRVALLTYLALASPRGHANATPFSPSFGPSTTPSTPATP